MGKRFKILTTEDITNKINTQYKRVQLSENNWQLYSKISDNSRVYRQAINVGNTMKADSNIIDFSLIVDGSDSVHITRTINITLTQSTVSYYSQDGVTYTASSEYAYIDEGLEELFSGTVILNQNVPPNFSKNSIGSISIIRNGTSTPSVISTDNYMTFNNTISITLNDNGGALVAGDTLRINLDYYYSKTVQAEKIDRIDCYDSIIDVFTEGNDYPRGNLIFNLEYITNPETPSIITTQATIPTNSNYEKIIST